MRIRRLLTVLVAGFLPLVSNGEKTPPDKDAQRTKRELAKDLRQETRERRQDAREFSQQKATQRRKASEDKKTPPAQQD